MSSRSLVSLDGHFGDLTHERGSAHGVWFDCPTCNPAHGIFVPFAGVSPYRDGPWTLQGPPDLDVLTLTPSVNLDMPREWPKEWPDERKALAEANRCKFHGFVTKGQVTW